MKQLFTKLIVGIFLFLAAIPLSQAQFVVSGEFRPRFEYRDGYLRLRDSSMTPYLTVPGRNRLIFDYRSDRFQARFSVQHAYVFGDNNYSSDTITKNTINIYEGWFRYNFTTNFAVKIGRTELTYDDGRILGNSNWGPKGASHDAAIIQWEIPRQKYRGDFGFAINNTSPASAYLQPYPLKNYKYLGYLYEQRKFFGDKMTLSLLAVLDVYQKPSTTLKTTSTRYDTLYITNPNHDTIGTTVIPTKTTTSVTTAYPDQLYGRFTIGGTLGYMAGKLKLFGSGYWQTGHFMNGKTINAGMIGVYGSYQVLKKLNLLVGYDYLSGNNYSDTTAFKTKSTAFATLYPNSHGFYGYMDMFSALNTTGVSPGLTDLYLKATFAFSEKVFIEGTFRYFGMAQGYLLSTPKRPGDLPYVSVARHLGSEFDLMAVYKPHKSIEFNAAYCFFLPTESMEILNGLQAGTSKFAQYAYLMITFKPTFFDSSKH